jgi:uncharacterized HAD superfamily protein
LFLSGNNYQYGEKMIDGNGSRDNSGKTRFDLIPPFAEEQYAKVLTKGSIKYAERNWERGMAWSKVIASLKRHIQAIESGEDIDKETGLFHSAHVMCNSAFLTEYYRIYPQGDDRPKRIIPCIGLDIDGVLADFDGMFKEWFGITHDTDHWNFTYKYRDFHKGIDTDEKFWLSLKPLIDGTKLPFEPVLYCTNRYIPTTITEQWLENNHFPCVKVITVNGNKIEALKGKVDIFVDDHYDNYVELNNAGICTYLWDKPYNRKYDVGFKRLTDLKQLV